MGATQANNPLNEQVLRALSGCALNELLPHRGLIERRVLELSRLDIRLGIRLGSALAASRGVGGCSGASTRPAAAKRSRPEGRGGLTPSWTSPPSAQVL